MTDFEQRENPSKLRLLLKELDNSAAQKPARRELERRKFIARVIQREDRENSGASMRLILGVSLGLAVAAAAAAITLRLRDNSKESEPVLVSGLWKVQPDDPFIRGRTLRVPPKTGAKIVLTDGTALWLSGGSEITARNHNLDVVRLTRGRLLASVTERENPVGFRVETPEGTVVVHGTVFSTIVESGGLCTRLYEGAVTMEVGDDALTLSPGHQLRIDSGKVLSMTSVDRAALIADLMIAEKTAALEGPDLPSIGLPAEATVRKPDVHTQVTPEPVPLMKRPRSTEKRTDRSSPLEEKEPSSVDTEDTPAREAEFTDPELEAIKVEPRSFGSLPGEDVLVEQAYEELRSGHHAKARELLEEYISEYPKGRYWQHVKDAIGD